MADYDINHSGGINSTLFGLDKMDTKIHVPEVVKSDAVVHLPETVTSDATVHVPEVVKSDATVHMPEPLTVDSSLDIQPMAVDSCVRLVLGPVPPTRVRSPWEQRVSMSLLGVELFSVAVSGELNTYVDSLHSGPKVIDDADVRQHHDGGGVHAHSPTAPRGLEIRLG